MRYNFYSLIFWYMSKEFTIAIISSFLKTFRHHYTDLKLCDVKFTPPIFFLESISHSISIFSIFIYVLFAELISFEWQLDITKTFVSFQSVAVMPLLQYWNSQALLWIEFAIELTLEQESINISAYILWVNGLCQLIYHPFPKGVIYFLEIFTWVYFEVVNVPGLSHLYHSLIPIFIGFMGGTI